MHCNCSDSRSFQEILQRAGSALTAHWFEETGSTNDDAKAMVRASFDTVGLVLVADRQSAGRGTRGRVWVNPAVSVLMTVTVPLPESVREFSALSLVIGAACVWQLQKRNAAARLKWPNDVWIGGGKAAGLLCELVKSRAGRVHAVAGIGVNIDLGSAGPATTDVAPAALFEKLPPAAADVRALRRDVAASLALAIEKACRDFSAASVDAVRALWPTLDAFAGQRVRAQLPVGASLTGRTVGLAAHGELLLEDDEGRVHRLTDARVRPLDNE